MSIRMRRPAPGYYVSERILTKAVDNGIGWHIYSLGMTLSAICRT
jgi:hypothetical protein